MIYFSRFRLPNDSRLMPTLGNGHLGFTVLSDAVYMNGLYNGRAGLSHRARIPNFSNIFLADCLRRSCKYTLNVKLGYFMVELVVENQFIASHLLYAHRQHDRALINQIHIQRLGSGGERVPCGSWLPSLPLFCNANLASAFMGTQLALIFMTNSSSQWRFIRFIMMHFHWQRTVTTENRMRTFTN